MRNTTSLALNIHKLNTTRWTLAPTFTQAHEGNTSVKISKTDWHYEVSYNNHCGQTTGLFVPPAHELWSQLEEEEGEEEESIASLLQFSFNYSPAENEVIYRGGVSIRSINETFSAAAMTKILQWPGDNIKKQFPQTNWI